MDNILIAATVIGAVVLAITQMIKQMVTDNRWLPLINVVLGIAIGLIYALTIVGGDFAVYGWAGALAGLSAGGFYDLGKGLASK